MLNFDTTRTYDLVDSNTAQSLAYALAEFLDVEKNMITQTMRNRNGYVVQCKGDATAEWTKYLGLDAALTIELRQANDQLTVTIGTEKWVEKLGLTAVGYIFFQPLAITAGIGAVRQIALFQDIFNFIETTLGIGPTNLSAREEAASDIIDPELVHCPHCGAINKAGMTYCKSCGERLDSKPQQIVCDNCGAELDGDEKYCPFCGHQVQE